MTQTHFSLNTAYSIACSETLPLKPHYITGGENPAA